MASGHMMQMQPLWVASYLSAKSLHRLHSTVKSVIQSTHRQGADTGLKTSSLPRPPWCRADVQSPPVFHLRRNRERQVLATSYDLPSAALRFILRMAPAVAWRKKYHFIHCSAKRDSVQCSAPGCDNRAVITGSTDARHRCGHSADSMQANSAAVLVRGFVNLVCKFSAKSVTEQARDSAFVIRILQ